MNLYYQTILNFYTHENRKILCNIKVKPKSHKFKNTCSYLTEDQWINFDQELQTLLNIKECWRNDKSIKFNIKPDIVVKVQKSKLSHKYVGKLLDALDKCNEDSRINFIEPSLVLECLIDFQVEVPLSVLDETQEYDPQIVTSTDGSQLQYEPYTASKKKLVEGKIDIKNINRPNILKDSEDTYSPKPICEVDGNVVHLIKAVPKYTPAPINTGFGSQKRNDINFFNDPIKETVEHISYSDNQKLLRRKLRQNCEKRIEYEYIPKSQKVTRVNVPVYIPTPIRETTFAQNLFKIDNIRQNKKRSNTIDVFPDDLDKSIRELQFQEIELVNEETDMVSNKNILKKRSMTIDEIPSALANMPIYIPTSKKESRSPPMDAVPKVFDEKSRGSFPSDKVEMGCKKKYLKNRSMTIDEIPIALQEINTLSTAKEKIHDMNKRLSKIKKRSIPKEKKPEKQLKISSSNEDESTVTLAKNSRRSLKIKKTENDVKLETGNKFYKNIKPDVDVHIEKPARKDKNREVSGTERSKAFRKSERSPIKPKRLIEEENNYKKHKSSRKNKELFGTDDDDDDDEMRGGKSDNKPISTYVENTVITKFPDCSLSSSSTLRKRKIDKDGENVREKPDICKKSPRKKVGSISENTTKSSKAMYSSSSSKLSPLKTSKKLKSQKSCSEVDNCAKPSSPTLITIELLSMEKKGKRER